MKTDFQVVTFRDKCMEDEADDWAGNWVIHYVEETYSYTLTEFSVPFITIP